MIREHPLAQDVVVAQVRRLAPQATGLLIRRPLLDAAFPDSSDLDLLAFDDIEDLYPQRLALVVDGGARSADITWLPLQWLDNPREMAARGLIAHRLTTSEPLFFTSPALAHRVREVDTAFRSIEATTQRVGGFFQMASLTVREVGITWDFPALAMFWLHMAYGACLAAAVDGRGQACPNIYTQPLGYLEALGPYGARLAPEWIARLRLDVQPASVAAATARIYERVAAACSEPVWPAEMRSTTRCEYRYWLAREERDYRLAVAAEMARLGSPEAAVHSLGS